MTEESGKGTQKVYRMAVSGLKHIESSDTAVNKWKALLEGYRLAPDYADEQAAYLTCVLALKSVSEGNAGVGCVIADERGAVVVSGHNKVFHPYFRSDLHGEMVTMNAFEDMKLEIAPKTLTLYTSVEPCPMCMVRMIASGIGRVSYLARDELWGMTENRDRLPPTWKDLAEGKVIGRADCSSELIEASFEIFNINIDALYEILKKR